MDNIVVIEDDPRISEAITTILKMSGFNVTTAFDGATGLKMIQDEFPDLVVCDVNLPCMSGIDVLKNVNADNSMQMKPGFIFVTAGPYKEMIDDIMSPLVVAYISKPFRNKEIIQHIEGYVNS